MRPAVPQVPGHHVVRRFWADGQVSPRRAGLPWADKAHSSSSYYTLIMWFPEIFERFNQFSKKHPTETAGVCRVSEGYSGADAKVCDNSINTRVFLDTFIIGLSCVPTSVSLSFFMRRLGKKFVLSKFIG